MKLVRTPEYNAWINMKQRCINPKRHDYERYGGRGLSVSAEWLTSFNSFYEYIGRRPSKLYSVERIDNSKGYEPGNVRWATSKEQASNRRSSRLFTIKGETKTLKQWCEELGLPYKTIWKRIKNGSTIEKALR